VFLDVPMNDVRLLDRGDRAILDRINVLPDAKPFEGTVTRFSASLDASSRLMRVEIDLPNPERRLLPGYYGYVTVYLEELPDTPVVPSSALLSAAGETYVVVCDNGQARRCRVTICYQDGTSIGIESGLEGGEQVVRAGAGQISDGQAITSIVAQSQ
jgi:RND family efflux transporter MFP subunit